LKQKKGLARVVMAKRKRHTRQNPLKSKVRVELIFAETTWDVSMTVDDCAKWVKFKFIEKR
jgi:hypothetical protein